MFFWTVRNVSITFKKFSEQFTCNVRKSNFQSWNSIFYMYRAYLGLEKQHKNKYQSKTFFLIQNNMGKLLILISRNQDIVSFHFREKKEDLISSFNCSAVGLRFDYSSKKTKLNDRLTGYKLHLFRFRWGLKSAWI